MTMFTKLIKEINNSKYFSIQADESTDAVQFAVFIIIVKYLNGSESVGLLLCHYTTGVDIFMPLKHTLLKKEESGQSAVF